MDYLINKLKTSKLKEILYDARFIKSIEILTNVNILLAIYIVRLYTGFGLALAKKYIYNIAKFKKKMRNPLQY